MVDSASAQLQVQVKERESKVTTTYFDEDVNSRHQAGTFDSTGDQ